MQFNARWAIVVAMTSTLQVCAQQGKTVLRPDPALLQQISRNLEFAGAQYRVLAKNVPEDSLPETWEQGKLRATTARNWVSGFYPGTLLYLYRATGDTALYEAGLAKLKVLGPVKTIDSHDIGFMMYCSFGNAYKIHPDAAFKQVLLTSAQSLIKRFNPTVGCTMSWNSKPGEFRVIIDNMMNLELLMWATKVTGDSVYARVAITHANTTLKNHFRPDGSSFHLVNYDPSTGAVIKKHTVQGYADHSAWARGQAWGLYGFTMMYRETGDQRYLDQANRIAAFILGHPNLPADKVPYWDFNSPGIPNAYRDASAGAICAAALVELAGYAERAAATRYLHAAETIIRTLSSNRFTVPYGGRGGFILDHSTGHLPKGTMIDVPLTYADYYYVEAMLRYRALSAPRLLQ